MFRFFKALNILLPLLIGVTAYFILKPDALISLSISQVTGFSVDVGLCDSKILLFIKNHFCDMCWSYSLVFAVEPALNRCERSKAYACLINTLMTLFIELCQLKSYIFGTFDVWDIVLQILSGIIAVWIIKLKEKEVLTK